MPPPATRRRGTRPGTAGHTPPPCPAHQEVCNSSVSSHSTSPAVVADAVVLRLLLDVVLFVCGNASLASHPKCGRASTRLGMLLLSCTVLVAPCANPASPAPFCVRCSQGSARLCSNLSHLLRCRGSHWDCGPPRTVQALSHRRHRAAHHGVSWACEVPVSDWGPGVPHVTPSERGA